VSKPPFATGACCPPSVSGITYLKVGPQKRTVGMQKLDEIFQELIDSNCTPDEVMDDQLISMARRFNYIARNPSNEADYAEALRRSFRTFYLQNKDQ